MNTAVVETHGGIRAMVRPARPSDQSYVASSWSIALARAGGVRIGGCRDTVDALLDHPSVRVVIACDPAETDHIMGWLAFTPMPGVRCVHFVVVRAPLRDKGLASALRAAAGLADERPLVFTLRGPCAKSLEHKYPTAIYQPIEEFLQ